GGARLVRAGGGVGLGQGPAGVFLGYTRSAFPVALGVVTGFFGEVPAELFESARIDGCTPVQALFKIFLPLALPGLATTGILVFIFAYNEFLYALTFTSSPEKRTIPVAISLLASEHKEPWGEMAAVSVMAVLPIVAAAIVFQRHIVSGLTRGAVKG